MGLSQDPVEALCAPPGEQLPILPNEPRVPAPGIDLLRWKPLRRLALWPGFPYSIQAFMLAVLAGLAILGWGLLTPAGVPGKLYAKTNLVNLAVWGLFWPGIVWVTVLFGRIWCGICPLELVSNLTERLGRTLGIPQGQLPGWLRAGWLMVVLYAVVQLAVAGLQLHRVPAYSSVFLLGMLVTAAVTGLLLRDRAYCRGFCPVAPLLKVYGRGGMLAVRSGGGETCAPCTDKTCSAAGMRTRLDARSCPTLLNPEKLDRSEDCLLCGQCLKNCQPANMRLLLRAPLAREDRRSALASWPLTIFIVILSGFVTYEVASEWAAAKEVFLAPAVWVTGVLGLKSVAAWVDGAWTLLVFPLVLWTALAALTVALRGAKGFGEAIRQLALPLAVVLAAGHMAKGLAKAVSWAGFLPGAIQQPDGIANASAMAAKTLAQPASLLPMTVVSAAGVTLVVFGFWYALRELRIANGQTGWAWRVPAMLLAGAYCWVIFRWGYLL